MTSFQRKTVDLDEKQQLTASSRSSCHGDDWLSNLSDAQWEFLTLVKNEATVEENQIEKKVESIMKDGNKSKDHERKQVIHLKQEMSVMYKKSRLQELDLRWGQEQKEALQEELECVKKELQSMKQAAGDQRTQQHCLKDQLDKVMKERDGLNVKLLECKGDCSELRDKMTDQQSVLKSKESQCQEQKKQIHFLKLENKKLKKERDMKHTEAEYKRQELRRCEETLQIQMGMPKKIVILKGKTHTWFIRNHSKDMTVRDNESLQKELCRRNKELTAATEELKKTQQRCQDMKQSLTHVSVQLQQCKAQFREQNKKLTAMTAERNMYRSELEEQRAESADEVMKQLRREKLKTKVSKKTKKAELSPGEKSSQSHPTPVSISAQLQSALWVIPAKINK